MSFLLNQHKSIRMTLLLIALFLWIIIGLLEYYLLNFFNVMLFNFSSMFGINLEAHMLSKFPVYLYNILYCGLCIGIIHIMFLHSPTTRIAIILYLVLFILTVILNEAGKLFLYEPFRTTAYRMMTIIVSPFLLIVLIPAKLLFHNHLPPQRVAK